MSCKWDDKLVTVILNAYEKHPCLWNPYHKDYYDCTAKNQALQRTINEISIPGFTVIDYLQQIKIIREKYAKEQMRTIKGLQSQKPYRSPFCWYEKVAGMLLKVIDDEEKANSSLTVSKNNRPLDSSIPTSLSTNITKKMRKSGTILWNEERQIFPCTDATCNTVEEKRKKSEEMMYLGSGSGKGDRHKDNSTKFSLDYSPTKDSGSKRIGHQTICSRETKKLGWNNSEKSTGDVLDSPLYCSSCGWKDMKYGKGETLTEEKTICYSPHKDSYNVQYELCPGHSGEHYVEQNPRVIDTKAVPEVPPVNTMCRSNEVGTNVQNYREISCNRRDTISMTQKSIDEAVQCNNEEKNFTNIVQSRPIYEAHEVLKLIPEVANKLECGLLEACTKVRMILSELNRNCSSSTTTKDQISRCVQAVQRTKQQSVATSELSDDRQKKKESSESYMCRSKKRTNHKLTNADSDELQNTVCISHKVACQTDLKCCSSQQTTDSGHVDSQLKKVMESKCCQDKVILRSELKQTGVNTLEHADKAVQSKIGVSIGNLTECLCFEKTKEVATNTETLACTAQDTHVCKSSELKNLDLCAGNVFLVIPQRKCISLVESKLTKAKKYCIGMEPEISGEKNDECKCIMKDGYVIDIGDMMEKIRDCSVEVSKTSPNVDYSENEFFKDLQSKNNERSTNEQIGTQSSAKELSTTENSTFLNKHTNFEETDLTGYYELPYLDNKDQRISENDTDLLEGKQKDPSFKDKEVFAYSKKRDIGTDGSLSILSTHDVGIQGNTQLLNDSVSPAKCVGNTRKRMSTGTQKRDPMLVHVIKCNNEQAIVKSDKTTLTPEINSDLKKYIDKKVETCAQLNCPWRYSCQEYSVSNISNNVRKKEPNKENCKRLLMYKNYKCDDNCKGRMSFSKDWTNVMTTDAYCNLNDSQIPLSARMYKSRKKQNF